MNRKTISRMLSAEAIVSLAFTLNLSNGCIREPGPVPAVIEDRIARYVNNLQNEHSDCSKDDYDLLEKEILALSDVSLRVKCLESWWNRMRRLDVSRLPYYPQSHSICNALRADAAIYRGFRDSGDSNCRHLYVYLDVMKWYREQLRRFAREEREGAQMKDYFGTCKNYHMGNYQMAVYGFEEMWIDEALKTLPDADYKAIVGKAEQFLGRPIRTVEEMWKAQGQAVKSGFFPDALFALYGTTNAPTAKKGDPK